MKRTNTNLENSAQDAEAQIQGFMTPERRCEGENVTNAWNAGRLKNI